MNKSKCPVCDSLHTKRNGKRNGVQVYKCIDCGYQFRNSKRPSTDELWRVYQENKQTISELSALYHTSESTIKRMLSNVKKEWKQPDISGRSGYVHLDATYWGHNWGVMLAIEEASGYPLYVEFIKSETNADYLTAVHSIEERGYVIKGLIIDGKQTLFSMFASYNLQMCQFHMKQIVRRYLTRNPRLMAARALKRLMENLTSLTEVTFKQEYQLWKNDWADTLGKRSLLKSGRSQYTHKRLRSAMRSIDLYVPYLFTYQKLECKGMPNTNNKIEGTFTNLKKNLNNHCGMSMENRKRFICGFFLALIKALSIKKQGTQ